MGGYCFYPDFRRSTSKKFFKKYLTINSIYDIIIMGSGVDTEDANTEGAINTLAH